MFRTILLVDDDDDVLRVMVRNLERSFTVRQASSYDQALTELRRGGVDAVVTDDHMGPPDGIDLLDRVRSDHPGVRRVLCSGMPPPGAEYFAHLVLQKPLCEPTDLVRSIEALFGSNDV